MSSHPEGTEGDPIRSAGDEVGRTGVVPAESPAPGEAPGDVVDHYELVREIGEGGMGSVWLARQAEPIEREVAFKIIKLGMDTREVVVRFEAERQALALMDHPYIAKVLDGGVTGGGRPYFVMELVNGVPITDYCNQERLGLRARLELFSKVCEAVQHAHHKGIIHRDIKPSNVLVAIHDGAPVPKVIDFGIAKATSAQLTQKTLFTQMGQMIGTPEYMAPEQAGMDDLDIDTRADVYSLGVLLYELLTGTKPFDIRQALEAGYEELLRTIREVDPAKPSTRVSSLRGTDSEVADMQQVNVEALSKRLRGDLDWIVMRALEKERTRRYDTPNGFAADIARYLNDEPVEAVPPSVSYRLSKLVRRRKKTVAAVAVIALVVTVGAIGTSWGWWEAYHRGLELELALEQESRALEKESLARAFAEEQQGIAEDERDRAVSAEQNAIAKSDTLERVSDFQRARLDAVDLSGMGRGIRRSVLDVVPEERRAAATELLDGVNFTTVAASTMRESIFEPTQAAIEAEFADDTGLQSMLLQHLARSMSQVGATSASRDAQERALALVREQSHSGNAQLVQSLLSAASMYTANAELDEALRLAEEALAEAEKTFGRLSRQALQAQNGIGTALMAAGRSDEALEHIELVVQEGTAVLGPGDELIEGARVSYGRLLGAVGEADRAIEVLTELEADLAAGGEAKAPRRLFTLGCLGMMYGELEEHERAIALLEEAVAGMRPILGVEHSSTLVLLRSLGASHGESGDWSTGLELLEEAMAVFERTTPEGHYERWLTQAMIGEGLCATGRRTRGCELLEESVEELTEIFGPDHFALLEALEPLAEAHLERGRFRDAVPVLGDVLRLHELNGPEDSEQTVEARAKLGSALADSGALAEAEEVLREAHAESRRVLGPEHATTSGLAHGLGTALTKQNRHAGAEPFLREALEGKTALLGDRHLDVHKVEYELVRCLESQGKHAEALTYWIETKEDIARTKGPNTRNMAQTLIALGSSYSSLGRYEEAAVELEAAVRVAEAAVGETGTETFQALNALASCYDTSGDHAAALPWLELQVERRLKVSPPTHPYSVGCRANLGAGYYRNGRLEEAVDHMGFAANNAARCFGPFSDPTASITAVYAEILVALERVDEAEAHWTAVIEQAEAARRSDPGWVAWARTWVGRHRVQAGLHAEAETVLLEARAEALERWPEDSWKHRELANLLGAAIAGQGRFEEAEPELTASAEWMRSDAAMPSLAALYGNDHGDQALARVVAFYESWAAAEPDGGHGDSAATWREHLATWRARPVK